MNETSAKRKAALWVGAVFLLGAALGGVLGYIFAHHSVSANAVMSEQERRARRVQELTRDLNLTSAQAKQLDAILAQVHAEFKTIHERSDAQIDQTRQKGRDQVRTLLAPEQRPKYEELLKRLDEERKRESSQTGR